MSKRQPTELPGDIRTRRAMCDTCVFRRECDGGIRLATGRREEIHLQVVQGVNQLCHSDHDRTICRGGRDHALAIWARLGIIAEPTDEALAEAMLAAGVEPAPHARAVRR